MKLLISDLDGTLYPSKNYEIPDQFERNIEAVHKWVNHGNMFAVATARGVHHYPVLVEKIGMDASYIGVNGAEMRLPSGEVIMKRMKSSVFIDLCKFVKENKIDATVVTGLNDMWVWSSKECYPVINSTRKPFWEEANVLDLDSIDPNSEISGAKLFVHPAGRDKLKQQIIDLNYQVEVTTSDVDMIDIGPLNSSKGISILELCERYKISSDDIIVVGDSENDIPMFEVTENSYCISHAEPAVVAKASKVVNSVEEVIDIELG